jgi:DNA-binding beta-propeller fold protein YncE
MRRTLGASSAAIALVLAIAVPGAAQAPEITEVAGGLDAPRGVTVAEDGTIYVAEAGIGGSEPCIEHPELGQLCLGNTGAVTAISDGEAERIVENLPSVIAPTGESIGPADVVLDGRGRLIIAIGLGGGLEEREAFGDEAANDLGRIFRVGGEGNLRELADLIAFEEENNPDADQPGNERPDSNPHSLAWTEDGIVVSDAGGNSLLRVDADGEVEVLAVFPVTMQELPPELAAPPEGEGAPEPATSPVVDGETAATPEVGATPEAVATPEAAATPEVGATPGADATPGAGAAPEGQASPMMIPMDPVPTGVAVGPDGAFYVGELTGFPFPVGGASVWRVAEGEEPAVYATGFTNIIDVAFGQDGTLYVLEIAHQGLLSAGQLAGPPNGGLWRVPADGGEPELLLTEGLLMPGGMDVAEDGTIYISTCTVCPSAGAVVSVQP